MVRAVRESDPEREHAAFPSHGTRHQDTLSIHASAKINWFLHVIGKRRDGYHDIVSLMQCIGLSDELFLEPADSLVVESDMDIPVSENLVYKAASSLREYASCRKGARITLRKRIPVSAGLGGGSSDAASVLLGLNSLWGLRFRRDDLRDIGARIGSDVPFFFHAPAALVQGRGVRVKPVKIVSGVWILLVKPDIAVSTEWAYAAFDTMRRSALTKKPLNIKLFCQGLHKQDFPYLAPLLRNDLEDVVMRKYPVVGDIKRGLDEMGAEASLMSGSGPTVFGVFRTREKAERARIEMRPHWCSIVQTLT